MLSHRKHPRTLDWSAEQDALLGKVSDAEAAQKLGRKLSTVRARRERLRIPPAYLTQADYPRFVGLRLVHQDPWTKEEEALLGKASDTDVALQLNKSASRVRSRRLRLGIKTWGKERTSGHGVPTVSAEVIQLFTKHGDVELCRILKWSLKRVQQVRKQIVSVEKSKKRDWTEEEEKLLGTASDKVIAKKLNRTSVAVRHRRVLKGVRVRDPWTPEDDAILGTRPDQEIARLLGRKIWSVCWRRRLLGKRVYAAPNPLVWTAEEDAALATKPDAELAKQFGRTVGAVGTRRRILKKGPAPGSKACLKVWTPELDALLGTDSDLSIARKIGFNVFAVIERRRLLEIREYGSKHFRWTTAELDMVGKLRDSEIAIRLGIPRRKVMSQRHRMGLKQPKRRTSL